jgi:hypothetical protein
MNKTFAYHKPSTIGLERITYLRNKFSELEDAIKAHCPESRTRSVALTELETSAMWAIKSIVFNDPDSIVD